jgi:hypothetical protein
LQISLYVFGPAESRCPLSFYQKREGYSFAAAEEWGRQLEAAVRSFYIMRAKRLISQPEKTWLLRWVFNANEETLRLRKTGPEMPAQHDLSLAAEGGFDLPGYKQGFSLD